MDDGVIELSDSDVSVIVISDSDDVIDKKGEESKAVKLEQVEIKTNLVRSSVLSPIREVDSMSACSNDKRLRRPRPPTRRRGCRTA